MYHLMRDNLEKGVQTMETNNLGKLSDFSLTFHELFLDKRKDISYNHLVFDPFRLKGVEVS